MTDANSGIALSTVMAAVASINIYSWTSITMEFIYLSRALRLLNVKGHPNILLLSCVFDSWDSIAAVTQRSWVRILFKG